MAVAGNKSSLLVNITKNANSVKDLGSDRSDVSESLTTRELPKGDWWNIGNASTERSTATAVVYKLDLTNTEVSTRQLFAPPIQAVIPSSTTAMSTQSTQISPLSTNTLPQPSPADSSRSETSAVTQINSPTTKSFNIATGIATAEASVTAGSRHISYLPVLVVTEAAEMISDYNLDHSGQIFSTIVA